MSDKKTVDANGLESQIIDLINKLKELKDENRKLKQDLAQQKKDLAEANLKIAELNTNYNRLKLAKAYGWNEQSKRDANLRISRLVRDIDKCLGLLKEID